MKLKYQCPICGTQLRYEGLCWKCQSEQNRKEILGWTTEQIKEKQNGLIKNIRKLNDMEDPELTDFWQLLSYRDAITPEIQRAALAAEVFWPCEKSSAMAQRIICGSIQLCTDRWMDL